MPVPPCQQPNSFRRTTARARAEWEPKHKKLMSESLKRAMADSGMVAFLEFTEGTFSWLFASNSLCVINIRACRGRMRTRRCCGAGNGCWPHQRCKLKPHFQTCGVKILFPWLFHDFSMVDGFGGWSSVLSPGIALWDRLPQDALWGRHGTRCEALCSKRCLPTCTEHLGTC